MTRTRTLETVVPLAAAEPDGLLVTTNGAYVRLLEASQVLQPLRGGRDHRDVIRERLGALVGRLPAGQALQVIVEAESLDADGALAADWREIATAAAAARRRGDEPLAEAMHRFGYGLEQTVRRSAVAVQATQLRWTVACRWRPDHADLVRALRGQLGFETRQSRARTLSATAHERAAIDSLRFTQMVAGDLSAAGCELQPLDAIGALTALARCLRPRRPPRPRRLGRARASPRDRQHRRRPRTPPPAAQRLWYGPVVRPTRLGHTRVIRRHRADPASVGRTERHHAVVADAPHGDAASVAPGGSSHRHRSHPSPALTPASSQAAVG